MRIAALLLAGAVLALAPEAARAAAVTLQADGAHSGYVPRGGPAPPLARRWTVPLEGRLGYPVAADGRVFIVVVPRGGTPRPTVVALSLRTGRRLWIRDVTHPGVTFRAGLAYDGGRLFVARGTTGPGDTPVNGLWALDPATGRTLWEGAPYLDSSEPPVAAGGLVYVAVSDGLAAYRQADGTRAWLASTGGAGGAPTVTLTPDLAVMGIGCPPYVFRARRADGAVLTPPASGCTSGRGETLAFDGSRLFAGGLPGDDEAGVFDAASGNRLAGFRSDTIAAATPGVVIRSSGRRPGDDLRIFGEILVAEARGRVLWRFRGDGYLDSAPLVVGRTVYVGSGSGRVYGVDLRSGRTRWRSAAGPPVLAHLAAEGGLLLVPAKDRLVAFGSRRRG